MQSSQDTDGQEVTQLTSGMGHSRESTRLAAKPDVALVDVSALKGLGHVGLDHFV